MTPLEYLKQADREMAAGNGQKAAGLMWKAVEFTFIQLAEARGLDWKDFQKMASEIEKEDFDRRSRLTINILMAEALRDHGMDDPTERYELEGDVLESFLEGTREFVLTEHGKLS